MKDLIKRFWLKGFRLSSPHSLVYSQDPFGKVLTESVQGVPLSSAYNAMGELSLEGDATFAFDPWGRLIEKRQAPPPTMV